MSIHHKFKTCWWLWGCLSVPVIAFLLLQRYEDKAGDVWSDMGFMLYAIRHPEHYGWQYCREPLLWDVLAPLIFGWVAQCLLVVGWDSWQRRHGAVHAAS
jgi:hypothetical protein